MTRSLIAGTACTDERSTTMKKLASAATIAAALALAAAAAALADGPTITDSTRVVAPTNAANITAACGFTVLETYTLQARTISFTDDAGNLTRRITLASFDGALIKSSTGEALPWRGVWEQTRDFAAGTITINGLREDVQRPGQAPAAVLVGHIVIPASGSPVAIEETPRADFFDWWAEVCPAFTS